MNTNTCTIRKNEYDEYEVPTAFVFHNRREVAAEIYYTDDKQDAIDTAKFAHRDDVAITWRRGTYGVEE